MPITRGALLITNPGEAGAQNYCKGVYADVQNYSRFLDAAIGGWWYSSEVTSVDRPTRADVRRLVKALSEKDYQFIAFSGHGWYSSTDRATVLTLRAGEELSSLELLEGSKKRTIVLDCCREIYNDSALEESVERRKMAMARAITRRAPDGGRCRAAFDDKIKATADEIVILHSSTPPEKSGDDEKAGGHYTSSLIATADQWASEVAEEAWNLDPSSLSVVEAHNVAAPETTRRRGGKQHPHAEKPKSGPYFPFAVFAT